MMYKGEATFLCPCESKLYKLLYNVVCIYHSLIPWKFSTKELYDIYIYIYIWQKLATNLLKFSMWI